VATAFVGALAVRMAAAEEVKCDGKITKIDGNMITIDNMAKDQVMKIEPQTKITSGGKPVNPIDLKVGQLVKCVGDRHGDEVICTAMEIMRDTP
jgi:hypothetical protein